MPSPELLLRLVAAICMLSGATQALPLARETDFVAPPLRVEVEVFNRHSANFPGPYTLFPRPTSTGHHRQTAAASILVDDSLDPRHRAGGSRVRRQWTNSWGPPSYGNASRSFDGPTTVWTTVWVPTTIGTAPTGPVTALPTATSSGASSTSKQKGSVIASPVPGTNSPSTSAVTTSSFWFPNSTATFTSFTTTSSLLSSGLSSTSTTPTTLNTTQSTITSTLTSTFTSSSLISSPSSSSSPASTLSTSTSSTLTTAPPAPTSTLPPSAPGTLQMAFTNNLGSSNIHLYVTGLNSAGQVVMLNADGTFWIPSTGSSTPQPVPAEVAIPLPDSLVIPGYITSCRIWFADGTLDFQIVATADGTGLVAPTSVNPSDPSNDVNWGFVELTYTAQELFADISYVDFVGLPLGLQLTSGSGNAQNIPGVPGNGVELVCNKLKAQAEIDGQPWDQLCITDSNGNLIRVNSPGSFLPSNPSAFSGYFDSYIDQVWNAFATSPLTINTQDGDGDVACTTSSDGTLSCAGDNRPYNKPTAEDIFGCASGPFEILAGDNSIHVAVVPRLCAAFNRATFLISGGSVQPGVPPSAYYSAQPNNEYSAIVHEVEVDGQGYAFPYDDVAPSVTEEVAGAVFATDPGVLTVVIGGQ